MLAALAAGTLAVSSPAKALDPAAFVAVGGTLWWDNNGNGIQDQRDRPVPGAQMEYSWGAMTGRLSAGPDGRYNVYLPAQVPFSLCVLSFGQSAPLDMGIVPSVKDAGGDEARDSDVDVNNCVHGVSPRFGAQSTYDAGFRTVGPVSVGDRVWLDADGDGVQDLEETSLSGVTVTLKDTEGKPLGMAITGADGTYRLREDIGDDQRSPAVLEIEPDSRYQLCFAPSATGALPAGVTVADLRPTVRRAGDDEVDSDIGVDGCVALKTPSDGEDLKVDAGFTAAAVGATVQGFAWFDLNADGIQAEGELPLAGVTVTSSGAATTTGDDGFYVLSGLPTGTTSEICFDPSTAIGLPAPVLTGLRPTDANQGADETKDSDVLAPCFTTAVSEPGSIHTIDGGFGFSATPPITRGTIGDVVWLDTNRNGSQDDGEPRLGGVRITLKGAAGLALGGASTDSGGVYHMDPLLPDWDFALCFDASKATDLPAGVIAEDLRPTSADTGGDEETDSDIDEDGCVEIAEPSGGEDLAIDGGFVPRGPALALKAMVGEPTDIDDDGLIEIGDEVSYGYEVHNVGTVSLTDVEVTDDRIASISCPESALAPGERMMCAGGPYQVADADVAAREVINTATAYGTAPTGVVESNEETATVSIGRIVSTEQVMRYSLPASPGARLVTIAFYGDDSSADIGIGMASALGGAIVLLTGAACLLLLNGSRRTNR